MLAASRLPRLKLTLAVESSNSNGHQRPQHGSTIDSAGTELVGSTSSAETQHHQPTTQPKLLKEREHQPNPLKEMTLDHLAEDQHLDPTTFLRTGSLHDRTYTLRRTHATFYDDLAEPQI
jgi:hypothetical protein